MPQVLSGVDLYFKQPNDDKENNEISVSSVKLYLTHTPVRSNKEGRLQALEWGGCRTARYSGSSEGPGGRH